MENNEQIMNNVVENSTEELGTKNSGKVGKAIFGAGVAALIGGTVYKYVIKPIIQKHKAKKAKEQEEKEFQEFVENFDPKDEDSELSDEN